MLRVYVTGAYDSDNVLGVMDNIRQGLDASVDVIEGGFAVFSPWLDHQLFIRTNNVPIETIQAMSLAWLQVSDAVYLVPGNWAHSKDTQKEIERAEELGIPVFKHYKDLVAWSRTQDEN